MELRITQGRIVKVNAIKRTVAPRLLFRINQVHRTTTPANGRMTERVSAVNPRKNPASRKLAVVGVSMVKKRNRNDVSSRTKNGFSVPRPRGYTRSMG